jgi:hypothetical protein
VNTYAIERNIRRLEELLDHAIAEGDYEEQKALTAELREIEGHLADAQRWEEEGRERGWL